MSILHIFVENYETVEEQGEQFTVHLKGVELKEAMFSNLDLTRNGEFEMYLNYNTCTVDIFLDKVVLLSKQFNVVVMLEE